MVCCTPLWTFRFVPYNSTAPVKLLTLLTPLLLPPVSSVAVLPLMVSDPFDTMTLFTAPVGEPSTSSIVQLLPGNVVSVVADPVR